MFLRTPTRPRSIWRARRSRTPARWEPNPPQSARTSPRTTLATHVELISALPRLNCAQRALQAPSSPQSKRHERRSARRSSWHAARSSLIHAVGALPRGVGEGPHLPETGEQRLTGVGHLRVGVPARRGWPRVRLVHEAPGFACAGSAKSDAKTTTRTSRPSFMSRESLLRSPSGSLTDARSERGQWQPTRCGPARFSRVLRLVDCGATFRQRPSAPIGSACQSEAPEPRRRARHHRRRGIREAVAAPAARSTPRVSLPVVDHDEDREHCRDRHDCVEQVAPPASRIRRPNLAFLDDETSVPPLCAMVGLDGSTEPLPTIAAPLIPPGWERPPLAFPLSPGFDQARRRGSRRESEHFRECLDLRPRNQRWPRRGCTRRNHWSNSAASTRDEGKGVLRTRTDDATRLSRSSRGRRREACRR